MVGPWKFYIDSPQKRALDLCACSLDDDFGGGGAYGDGCEGYGWSNGSGTGGGYEYCNSAGGSAAQSYLWSNVKGGGTGGGIVSGYAFEWPDGDGGSADEW